MKTVYGVLILILLFQSLFAGKPKKMHKHILWIKGTYSNVDAIRKVGLVYEFTIKTLVKDIEIDSVWFGATPVPCDLYESLTMQKLPKAKQKGMYLIKANKNLYANYPEQIDSTEASKKFKAPFNFSGEPVIMYKLNGKRYYKKAGHITEVKQQPIRK